MTHSYRDLKVWQKAMDVVRLAYPVAASLPQNEQFALASQMRRSAVSIPSNIAEGQKRLGSVELARFCGIALGSVAELETQAMIAEEQYDIDVEQLMLALEEVSKMLTVMIRRLRKPR